MPQAELEQALPSARHAKEVHPVVQRRPKVHPAHHVHGRVARVLLVDLVLHRVGVAIEGEVEQAQAIAERHVGRVQLGRHLVVALPAKQGHADACNAAHMCACHTGSSIESFCGCTHPRNYPKTDAPSLPRLSTCHDWQMAAPACTRTCLPLPALPLTYQGHAQVLNDAVPLLADQRAHDHHWHHLAALDLTGGKGGAGVMLWRHNVLHPSRHAHGSSWTRMPCGMEHCTEADVALLPLCWTHQHLRGVGDVLEGHHAQRRPYAVGDPSFPVLVP